MPPVSDFGNKYAESAPVECEELMLLQKGFEDSVEF